MPAQAAQGRTRRGHGGIDLGLAGLVHLRDDLARERRALFEGFAGGDVGTVDEIRDLLHIEEGC